MGNALKPNRKYEHLYAIVRYVTNADEATPIDLRFLVTKVVSDGNYAQREANRLNTLNKDKDYHYFVQITRFEEVPPAAAPVPPMLLDSAAATPAREVTPPSQS